MLFVPDGGIEFHQDNRASVESHSLPFTQPSPGAQRTG
jgi:hypothetical protein